MPTLNQVFWLGFLAGSVIATFILVLAEVIG